MKVWEKLIKKAIHISRMSSLEHLRKVVRNLADTFNNQQIRESSYFDFYDDSLIIHGFPPNLPANKEGFKKFINLLWKAFPDIRIIFDDIIIEKNKVACRYNLTGTHKSEFMDLKPTDKQFTVNGMTVFSFHDTKCIERWNLVDMISLREQLRTQL
jgi:predicted ester cyclase